MHSHVGGLAGVCLQGFQHLLAGLAQRLLRRRGHGFNRCALLTRGLMEGLEQGSHLVHQGGTLFQREVISLSQPGHFLTPLHDHFGRGLWHLRGRLQQTCQRVLQCGAQCGQVKRHGSLQLTDSLDSGVAACGLLVSERTQLRAPHTGQLIHAVPLLRDPEGFRLHPGAHQFL